MNEQKVIEDLKGECKNLQHRIWALEELLRRVCYNVHPSLIREIKEALRYGE